MPKRIVILGGGYAGVLTAKKLAKKLKKHEVEITLVDKNPFHTLLTELHEVAAGRVEEDAVKIPFAKIFAGRKVKTVLDRIVSADLDGKVLKGEQAEYPYDFLVVASGSRPAYFGVEGAQRYALPLWSYQDAVRVREQVRSCFRQAVCIADPEKRREKLTFCVVGAGFTGAETAGELAEYLPFLCEEFGVSREEVRLLCADLLERPVPVLPEKLSAKVERRLKRMGCKLYLRTNVSRVGENSITFKTGEKEWTEQAATVIWTAGVEGSSTAQMLGQRLPSAGRGRLKTDEYLRAEGREDIYVAGDNIFYVPKGEERPAPQMVENAEHAADLIAHNLCCDVTGKGEKEVYKPVFHGVMVSVGGRYAAAHVGFPGRMFSLPSFFAMLVKHLINVVYYIQVAGWNQVLTYIRHEFFSMRSRRSVLGGHFAARTPNFWLVPLRVYLGIYWLVEGFKKLGEGWLRQPRLSGFFGGADQFFDSVLNGGAGVSSATAANSAGAAASSGEVVFHYDILGVFDALLVHGDDYAFRLKFSPMDWFVNRVILASEGTQLFFQILVVVSELVIGFSLIFGLFTFLSNAYALGLQAMFIMTTGLYMSTWWMIFAHIALLFGAGAVLGLDYYALPALKRWWSRLPFVKKWYIYNS
ncbi:MAG: NAD(P)/FAD-dependent oxidoreductase [Clostridiales bacterium]|nr:NAD(P)/FAD-dependent oxidoreductase [Clostridiales bacterium]